MQAFKQCFSNISPAVIAMIHVPALPGTPKNVLPIKEIIKVVNKEADIYRNCGVDGIMLENMHDIPYVIGDMNGPEITASMTALCHNAKSVFQGPVGVQILAGANKQALAVAQAADLQFIRAECFVFSHVADEGIMNGCAGELLRYRKHICAENILVFTDIKKKHCSHSITSDVSIEDTALSAEFFLSDGLIVTGSKTGQQADPRDLTDVMTHAELPVLVGSGITAGNVNKYVDVDGLIVGSHFKRCDWWCNEVMPEKVVQFMGVIDRHRNASNH